MTIQAASASIPRGASPAVVFSWALIAATVVPLFGFVAGAITPIVAPDLLLLTALATTHVGATAYLLSDSAIRRFCTANPIKMIALPGLIAIAGIAVFSTAGPLFVTCALALFLIQAWHFGAQNIGVATFISLSDRGRPLAKAEKIAIKAGIVIGMLGVLKAMSPTFLIDVDMPLPSTVVETIGFLHQAGALLALPLIVTAAVLAYRACRARTPLFGAGLFLSMTFLLPLYLTSNAYGFAYCVVAHGLQYLVFIGAHNGGRALRQRRAGITSSVLLLAIVFAGSLVWNCVPVMGNTASLTSLGTAIIFSLTLIHFWFDRFVWRMRDKERAQWIKERFEPVLLPR